MNLRVIGERFWICESVVALASRRLRDRLREDRQLQRKVAQVRKGLNPSG